MNTDAMLQTQIRDEITALMGIHADDVHMHVLHGAVTLSGTLQSEVQTWALRDAIHSMPGVTRLTDDTTVSPETFEALPDSQAERAWLPTV